MSGSCFNLGLGFRVRAEELRLRIWGVRAWSRSCRRPRRKDSFSSMLDIRRASKGRVGLKKDP